MPHQNTSQFNLLFLSFLLILFSCNPQKETTSFDEEKETVDISKMKRFDNVEEIIPDEFIRERKYIKLTSTDDDYLFKEINKVRIDRNSSIGFFISIRVKFTFGRLVIS